MAKQNIFDNETFFEGYQALREKEVNANNLFELPTLNALMPDLTGKRILDLGCGSGERCSDYLKRGAVSVVGIDISEKMLEVAKRENADPAITYLHMAMEDIASLEGPFDVAISSLALHYVEDFAGVIEKVHDLLSEGGIFLFSQEHPFSTCYTGKGERWTRDENGKKIHLNLADYCIEGKRETTWFVDGVQRYHRTFSTTVNTLAKAGFQILQMEEPYASPEILEKYPEYYDLFHKPDFLFVKAKKTSLH